MVEYNSVRRTPRYTIIVDAQITDVASKTQIKARTNTLSPLGCGVESSKIFPQGTDVRIKLFQGGAEVSACAIVVYSSPEQGMGFAFTSVEPECESILERWIAEN